MELGGGHPSPPPSIHPSCLLRWRLCPVTVKPKQPRRGAADSRIWEGERTPAQSSKVRAPNGKVAGGDPSPWVSSLHLGFYPPPPCLPIVMPDSPFWGLSSAHPCYPHSTTHAPNSICVTCVAQDSPHLHAPGEQPHGPRRIPPAAFSCTQARHSVGLRPQQGGELGRAPGRPGVRV